MRQIKACFFDIDGTLLDHGSGGGMPASTRAALAALRQRGIKVYIASGRGPFMLGQIRELFPFDGYISANGQFIQDGTGAPYPTRTHRPEDIRALGELGKREGFSAMIIEGMESFPLADDGVNRQLYGWLGVPMPTLYDPARLEKHPVIQFTVHLDNSAVGAGTEHYLERGRRLLAPLQGVEVTSAGGGILDCIPVGGGKEVGISRVCQRLGIRQEETLVFGDGLNDLRMLAWAGVGVAMGNAPQEVKAGADHVTAPVGEDGIARALAALGVLPDLAALGVAKSQ